MRLTSGASAVIEWMPEEYEDYRSATDDERVDIASGLAGVRGVLDFVVQNFQYRYVSAHDYLRTYNRRGERVFDLIVPSMVDYDWPLAGGSATGTPLDTQVDVMARIATLTRGRVHALVPYDPMRDVASDLGYAPSSSFALVRDAVEFRGCIGVKIYPTMGFAPFGNASLKQKDGSNFWRRPWLPPWMDRPDLGERLDGAMCRFFEWCIDCDVPVLAHTNLTNGVTEEFESLTDSPHWKRALTAFEPLRISFGHFGGAPLPVPPEERAMVSYERASSFARLMNEGGLGANAFADSGFFVEAIDKATDLQAAFARLLGETACKGGASLAHRFTYGTDWEMVLMNGSTGSYLEDFLRIIEAIRPTPCASSASVDRSLTERFFGWNAAAWLGLAAGKSRERLEAFYQCHGVQTPDWLVKVDRG